LDRGGPRPGDGCRKNRSDTGIRCWPPAERPHHTEGLLRLIGPRGLLHLLSLWAVDALHSTATLSIMRVPAACMGFGSCTVSIFPSPDRVGIRWLLPALKVYYIPFLPIASSATLPNFFTSLPYLRTILLREHIHLIHAHASLSSIGHEGILHSHLMGIRTVFTDHSLFGFDDAASILTNKLMVGTLKNVDAVICVSHTGYVSLQISIIRLLLIHSCLKPGKHSP
jgi:hypothetical protein